MQSFFNNSKSTRGLAILQLYMRQILAVPRKKLSEKLDAWVYKGVCLYMVEDFSGLPSVVVVNYEVRLSSWMENCRYFWAISHTGYHGNKSRSLCYINGF